MNLSQYLKETKYATSNIIKLIWYEFNEINKISNEINILEKSVQINYQRAQYLMDSEDSDDVMMGAGIKWDTYFGEDKELFKKTEKRKKLIANFDVHYFSIQILSTSLLQIAKQGISIAHGSLTKCPNGRNIGSQYLKNVIWQSRNQANHFEAGTFHSSVNKCFSLLKKEINKIFGDCNKKIWLLK